jgi:phospholipid/cholesterol/gamma-HCH transport system substrate-binding protein
LTRWNTDLKVGLFILLSVVALFFMTLKIGGTIPIFGKRGEQQLIIIFNRVSGVSEKSNVKMAGVDIGKVRSIELEGRKAKVTIDLDEGVKIPVDSVASIRSSGLLGEKFIDINPGESDTYLENRAVLPKSIDPTDIDEMMTKLSSALDDIQLFTRTLRESFAADEDGEGGLKSVVDNLIEMTESVNRIVSDNEKNLNAIMNNATSATKLLKEILAENRANIKATIENVKKLTENIDEVVAENRANLKEGIENFKDLTGNIDTVVAENRENFRVSMENLKKSSEKLDEIMASIQQISGKMEKGEGTIGKLIQEDDVYENLSKTLMGTQGFVGKIENIKIALGLRSERHFESAQTKSYFSLRVKPREDKYYLFEITEDVRRNDLTTTRNTLNSLLYSFIIAKRYGDVTLKAGLIESSGGIGLDFHAWRDSIMLSAALFNFSGYDFNAENPQFKLTGRFYIQKYLYIYLGGDELLNDYYRTYLAGVGLMVDEDDFKFLLSIF